MKTLNRVQPRTRAVTVAVAIGVSSLSMSAVAHADGLQYALRAGANYSDNINRLPSGFEQGTSAIVAGVEARGRRETGRFRYDVAADLSRYEFLDLGLAGQTLGRGFASAAWDLVPSSFTWNARVDYDQLREDILRPFAIGNIADQLTLATGPTITARLASSWEAVLDGRYVNTDYSSFGVDNQTLGGRFMLQHRFSPQALVGLGASRDDVEYDGAPTFDYDRQELFLNFRRSGVRTSLDLQVGYSEISGRTFTSDGAMVRVNLSRELSPTLTANVGYVREYPTSAAALAGTDPTFGGGGVFDASFLTAAPRLAQSGLFGLSYNIARTRVDVSYALRRESSLLVALGDRTYNEYRVQASRAITPRTTGALYALRTDEDFSAFALDFNDQALGGQLAFGVGSPLGIDVRLEYRKRDAPPALGSFSELSGGVYLRYNGQLGSGTTAGQARPAR